MVYNTAHTQPNPGARPDKEQKAEQPTLFYQQYLYANAQYSERLWTKTT